MKIVKLYLVVLVIISLSFVCGSDTFFNEATGQILYGYRSSKTEYGKMSVYTIQHGFTTLHIDDWDVVQDSHGRKKTVAVVEITGSLDLRIVTDSIIEAIEESASSGPQFVLVEINSSGGDARYVERFCDTIMRIDYCPVVAFIKTGNNGGALSGAAAIALACDKIVMAPDAAIGAASIATSYSNELKTAWQKFIEAIADTKNRSGLLARAMVDKGLEVVEVLNGNKREFVKADSVKAEHAIVRSWSKSGSLLTLTAQEAVQCGMADVIAKSRGELLRKLGVTDVSIYVDGRVARAKSTFKKVKLKFDRLRNSLDVQIKKAEQTESLEEAIILIKKIKRDYESLLLLAKRYPDLAVDTKLIEEQINHAELYYEKAQKRQQLINASLADKKKSNS